MNSPNKRVWIRRDVVLAAHEAQIAEHGGLLGVRDSALLDSALARPRTADEYAENRLEIPAIGALYAIAVIRNHPFVDGNKRVGLILCELFLELNGCRLEAFDRDVVDVIRDLAAGSLSDDAFTAWVQQATRAESP